MAINLLRSVRRVTRFGTLAFVLLPMLSIASDIDLERFEKEVVVSACADPMQMEVLKDGRILFIERAGPVKMYSPIDSKVVTIGIVPVELYCEVGLLGLAVPPDFDQTGFIYIFHCPKDRREYLRLSRFTIRNNQLLLESEVMMFEYTMQTVGCHHQGGGLAWGSDGCIYIGTGDNSYPIPELPVDQRVGQENNDALRTSGNSMDLRGKILRIRPTPNGIYEIPKDNLFPDGKQGRPEIYCMGIRNAFRLTVDPKNGWVYWGDVGPNVWKQFELGPSGYDEFNQARAAGNFGWPMFVGPNEAYRDYDFENRKAGEKFDAKAPYNHSRNNTGAKALPLPQPALVWYPTEETSQFAGMGSGGRAAMAGPVYYDRPEYDATLKLPQEYEGSLLAFDWMRNWVKLVHFDQKGDFASIEPFASGMTFRRPIEMKLGPDGTLYVIEFGDKWGGNTDSRIVRIVYRRGNRAPIAEVSANPTAGRPPLTVAFNGLKSNDKDHDPLTYEWFVGNEAAPRASGPTTNLKFDKAGTFKIRLSVRDNHGAVGSSETLMHVGNSPPELRITAPTDGSFFDWNDPIPYSVVVDDFEEGSTTNGRIAPARVNVRTELRLRGKWDTESSDPGLTVMRRSNCFGCHSTTATSGGPPYALVSKKYKEDPEAKDRLAKKVLSGGSGVWGSHMMPPQSHLSIEQARSAVDWVLKSADSSTTNLFIGPEGVLTTPPDHPPDDRSRRMLITASFTDNGAEGAPSLTAEESVTLLSRHQRAAFADVITGGEVVDELEGGERLTVRLAKGGSINFGRVDLTGVDRVAIRLGETTGGDLEFRSGSGDRRSFGRTTIEPIDKFGTVKFPLTNPGVTDSLTLVAMTPMTVVYVDFRESDSAKAARTLRSQVARERQKAIEALNQPRTFVKKWTTTDLAPRLAEASSGRSLERGWAVFRRASCVNCHRLGGFGGILGPDLTDVAKHMAKQTNPRLALLHELVEPSRVIAEAYKPVNILTSDGRQQVGIIVSQTEEVIQLRVLPPASPDIKEFRKADIDELVPMNLSPMPEGALDLLTIDEIFDLIALLESSGNPASTSYQK